MYLAGPWSGVTVGRVICGISTGLGAGGGVGGVAVGLGGVGGRTGIVAPAGGWGGFGIAGTGGGTGVGAGTGLGAGGGVGGVGRLAGAGRGAGGGLAGAGDCWRCCATSASIDLMRLMSWGGCVEVTAGVGVGCDGWSAMGETEMISIIPPSRASGKPLQVRNGHREGSAAHQLRVDDALGDDDLHGIL